MDLAISNGGDDTIYVLLGNGDGTFGVPEVLYTTGQSPVWLVAAQLRTTGHLDLIAVDGDSNQVEVFSGNGDGTFQPGTVVATLTQIPTFVLAGDFNNDGHLDLAVGLVVDADSTEPQFQVLLGDGNGSFPSSITPPPVNSTDSSVPTSWLASGDVNNDGRLDLVATVSYAGAITYLNEGGTGFQQGTVFNPADGAMAVALADMNGDGCLDAVEAGAGGFLTVAPGNCGGTFAQDGPTAELGDIDVAIAVADVNGDGKLDVVASSAYSNVDASSLAGVGAWGGYLVSVLDGDGAGHLTPAAIYRTGPDAYSLSLTDLSGNGFPDIVAISQTESTTSLLINDGKGGFGAPSGETVGYLGNRVVYNAPDPSATPLTVDLNGDDKPDVLLIELGPNSFDPPQATALLNDGTGRLSAPIRSPITVGPNDPYPAFVAGNFRGAAAADLIYVSTAFIPGVVAFMPGNGDGTFGAPVTVATLPSPALVVSGDFNGDGKLDFAVFGGNAQGSAEIDAFLGNGDGTFKHLAPQTFTPLTSDSPQQLIAGDFNHDGKLDLLMGFNTNSGWVVSGDDLDLALGNGDGTFQTAATLMAHFGPVAVADLNHDGYLDLVQARDPDADITQEALPLGVYITPAVTVYLGGPGGTFTKKATYYAPGIQIPSYEPALVGDFNGDGNPDVALPYVQATLGGLSERRLQIFQGNGDGTLTANGIPYQLPAYDLPVIGADYRGVGVTDLLDLVGATSSINTISASPAPALTITADSSPLTGAQGSATVTLALPASATESVQLNSSDPAVTLPGSLTFVSGQSQQSFTFTLSSGFDSTHLLAVSATLAGQTAIAYFAEPNPNLKPGVIATIGELTTSTTAVGTTVGGSISLLFTLQSIEGYSGVFSQFACAGLPAGAQCDFTEPSMTLLPGGFAQVAFAISIGLTTPSGMYNLTISASNNEISPAASLSLGVGGFSLSVNPAMIQENESSQPSTTVTAAYTNGFTGSIQLSCSGSLPPGVSCSIPGILYPSNPSTTVTVNAGGGGIPAQDYPFQIVGTSGNVTTSVNATVRVSSFSAALQKTSATVASGQSASFNVLLTSLNHFSNANISLVCPSTPGVTCTTSPQYASLSDGGTTTVVLSVTPQLLASATPLEPLWKLPWKATLACVALLVLPVRRPWRRSRQMLGLLLLCFLFGIAACNGGGSSGGGGGGGGSTQTTVYVGVAALASTATGTLQVGAGSIALTVTQ